MSTNIMANTKSTSQVNGHSSQSQYLNPTPIQSIQNIKYFLENYKSSKVK